MNVSSLSDSLTLIELSAEEVRQYGVSFSQEDYRSVSARLGLWRVLEEAQRLSGETIEADSCLEIDFMPDIKGGCLMILSFGEKEVGQKCEEVIYCTDSTDCLLDFAKALNGSYTDSSMLYERDGAYRLILAPTKLTEALADEFYLDTVTQTKEIEATKEGYRCLIAASALEVLCGHGAKQ